MSLRKHSKTPIVAIVGRANVGKSTLWNRITESGRAIVSSKPHTTRDRNYAPCLWRAHVFDVVDTGGMDTEKNVIGDGIRQQAEQAIQEANVVLFLIDSQTGILPQDVELAKKASSLNKHIILVANKTDRNTNLGTALSAEFWKLNLGEPQPISASSGKGIGDLLELITEKLVSLKKPPVPHQESQSLNVVIMGRPNVGKSSLMNAILGEERSIVSPIAHTTREPLDTHFTWNDQPVTLIDTAGMRKRARITEKLEHEGVERNRQALARADVAVLVVDATDDPRKQDKHLADLLQSMNRGMIVAINKWDLIPDKTTKTSHIFEDLVRQSLPFLAWAPFVFISAKKGQRVREILNMAFKIKEERLRVISDNAMDKFLKQTIARQKPRADKGSKTPFIVSIYQTGTNPPRFLATVRGAKTTVHQAWLKFFERKLREKFGFTGTPIALDIEHDATPVKIKPGPNRRRKPIGRRAGRY